MITITLDEEGQVLSDAQIEQWVDTVLDAGIDIHVANMLTIDCIRARLLAKQTKRSGDPLPGIKWVFYGKEVHFDCNLRSFDAYQHPLTDLTSKFLGELL